MPNHVAHFAIHADDLPRARRFYEQAFGWHFEPWGPPDFFMIRTGSVDDAAHAVERHGGKILMPKTVLPTVGTLIQFEDTEGNVVCAMQYEESAR
jgi:predicted enzyme related to lactoylglutathione lyase